MERRVSIQWTTTAKSQLAALPLKVRRGVLRKADELKSCADPKQAYKPLRGPLQGFYRFTFGRFRAVHSVDEECLANFDVLVHVRITFIAVGQRKVRDRKDIYRIAEKLVDTGLISLNDVGDDMHDASHDT